MFTFSAGLPVLVEHGVLHCGIIKAQTYTVSQTVWRGNMPVNNLSASPRHYQVKQHAGGIMVVLMPTDSADGPDVCKHSRYKWNMSEESLTVFRVNTLYENMQSQHDQCLSVCRCCSDVGNKHKLRGCSSRVNSRDTGDGENWSQTCFDENTRGSRGAEGLKTLSAVSWKDFTVCDK